MLTREQISDALVSLHAAISLVDKFPDGFYEKNWKYAAGLHDMASAYLAEKERADRLDDALKLSRNIAIPEKLELEQRATLAESRLADAREWVEAEIAKGILDSASIPVRVARESRYKTFMELRARLKPEDAAVGGKDGEK